MDGLKKELNAIKTGSVNKKMKIESYKIAVNKLSAQDWYTKGLRAKSLISGGDNEDAIFSFQKVIELDPKNKDAYWWLGTLYLFSSKAKEYIGAAQDSNIVQLAKNIKQTYTKNLLELLPSLNMLDIEDWFQYAVLLLIKLDDEVELLSKENVILKNNYNKFIHIWSAEFINKLQRNS